jgi:hypothetical protein
MTTRPAFMFQIVTSCIGGPNASAPTRTALGVGPWAYNCPTDTALSEIYWTQQRLPNGMPFLTSLAFKCTAAARIPQPAPPLVTSELGREGLICSWGV